MSYSLLNQGERFVPKCRPVIVSSYASIGAKGLPLFLAEFLVNIFVTAGIVLFANHQRNITTIVRYDT